MKLLLEDLCHISVPCSWLTQIYKSQFTQIKYKHLQGWLLGSDVGPELFIYLIYGFKC